MSHLLTGSCSVLATCLFAGAARAQLPPQPTNLQVFHRSGQTFLTWTEAGSPVDDESYRVYRVLNPSGPITSLTGVTRVFEVWEDSGEFYADRKQSDNGLPDDPRYAKRFVIQDGGPELGTDTALVVLTMGTSDFAGGSSGTAHYAVTTVDSSGVENTVAFGAGNATQAAISESIADPLPVRLGPDPQNANYPYVQIWIQYLDGRRWNSTFFAPNELNGYWGESSAAIKIQKARQYAATYKVATPNQPTPDGGWPVVVNLHAHAGNRAPEDYAFSPFAAIEIKPVDVNDTWWFGFGTTYDYRQANPVPDSGKIANYTEHRVLRMVHDLLRDPAMDGKVDPQRVYVYGHSMGGSGALSLAMRFPGVFAAANASKPMTDYLAYVNGQQPDADYRNDLKQRWGDPSVANLATVITAPNGWAAHLQPYAGTANRVWLWQNHQYQLGNLLKEEMVPFGLVQGLNDLTLPGATQCDPAYDDLTAARRAFGARVDCTGHAGGNPFRALPPALAEVNVGGQMVPFYGLTVRRDQTMPGLSNLVPVGGGATAQCIPPSSCLTNCPGNTTYFLDIESAQSWVVAGNPWAAAPVDTPTKWEMSLRVAPPGTALYAIDVTPRRTQQFHPAPNQQYTWQNEQGGGIVQSGTVTANAQGVVTVPGVLVTPAGNRVVIF